ncbi:FAR1 DNA binding domain [Macleaya cordata]|uniref:FAR1 DNA binding domain n=1 Tax=Macleaya cordata TaxID=56857 RepID=A0A200PP68_MACCD|nr:FAR1 DNA binding domain [Macleaya cordata]
MIFSSIEEAKDYYEEYGRGKGFSIRTRSSYVSGRGTKINRVIFSCSCGGVHKRKHSIDEANAKIKRNTSTMKTNCMASMRIALNPKQETCDLS